MSAREFYDWAAYFSVERANYSQTDINIAQIAHMVFSKNYKGKSSVYDYLPHLKKEKQSAQSIGNTFLSIGKSLQKNKK